MDREWPMVIPQFPCRRSAGPRDLTLSAERRNRQPRSNELQSIAWNALADRRRLVRDEIDEGVAKTDEALHVVDAML